MHRHLIGFGNDPLNDAFQNGSSGFARDRICSHTAAVYSRNKHETRKDDVRRNAEITVARMDLVELARKTPMDINAIEGRLKQISALDLNVQLSHFKAMAEIKSKLTPEQKRRLTSIRQGLGANKRSRRAPQKDLENNP